MSEKNPEDLESLVKELMKETPNKVVVRQLCQKLGIAYSSDLVKQMNCVLHSAHEIMKGPSNPRDLES